MAFITWANVACDTNIASDGAINSSVTTLNLASGGGAIVAAQARGGYAIPLYIAIEDEILEVTNISGDTLTIKRGAFGTTAASHANDTDVDIVNLGKLYKLIKAVAAAAAPGS